MKVELNQFLVRGDKIVHVPTGAEFWKGDNDVVNCDRGAGDSMGYDRNDLMEHARRIFARQRAVPLG
jgi:hypothetical protein